MSVCVPSTAWQRPDLLRCALLILEDGCPPDAGMQLCRLGEDPDVDCLRCWRHYLFWVANGRRGNPYG